MSQKLPDKVRAGDPLSAAWLNGIVDYLKYLNDMQARRRLLKGVGYAVSESPGGSSLTIDRQAFARVATDGLDILRNEDFELRIKPKGLCTVSKESGSWDKVVQVHTGRIVSRSATLLTVTRKDGGESGEAAGASTAWDAADWVDMATLKSLGDEGSTQEIAVYVKLLLELGRPVDASFCTSIGGSSDVDASEDSSDCLYIPVGTVSAANVEGTARYYITQQQQGPMEYIPLAQYGGEQDKGSDVDEGSSVDTSDVDGWPGLMASARAETPEESQGRRHWLITAGELLVPLAHAPLTESNPDAPEADTRRAGLILGVAVAPEAASNVDGSNVDGEAANTDHLWYIEHGILYHPPIKAAELCNFACPSEEANRDGIIRSIGSHSAGWLIQSGDIRVPLAQQDGQDESGWHGEGLVLRAGWLPDGESVPRVTLGQVLFPRLTTGTDREPLANFNNAPVADNVGTVRGIEYRSDIDSPRIADGMVQLQQPTEPGGGSDVDETGISYDFDPQWFLVSGTSVTLNTASLDELVAEAVDELSVNVTASGVLTHTEFGEIQYTTQTTNPSLANLSLDSNIAYT